jgi:hypothetical protein
MNSFLTPPPGYGPARLGAIATLGLVLAAFTLTPMLDSDTGVPAMSALAQAHGQVVNISPERYGVRFRLAARAETFDYPSKAGAYDTVQAALAAAGNKQVAVLYSPTPREPWGGPAYYDVWQIAINGQPVRTLAEVKAGWRSNNRVAAWLFPCFLLTGIYCAALASRARRASKRFDDRPWIDFA